MKYVFFFIASSVVVFCATIFFRLGAHKSVQIKEEQRNSFYVIYIEHRGAYHKINEAILKMEDFTAKNSIPCKVAFGEFLDNPESVDEKHLRSNAGCILPAPLEPTIAATMSARPEKIQTKEVPAGKWVVASFEGAPSIGPFKVYPKLNEYFFAKGLRLPTPIFEIYIPDDKGGMVTEYLAPITQ